MNVVGALKGLLGKPAAPPPPPRLSLTDYLKGRDNDQRYAPEYTPVIQTNAVELLKRVNALLDLFGHTPPITSGWRPMAVNKAVGGAPSSAHLTGQAIDLGDVDRHLCTWCAANLPELEKLGLWLEDPSRTKTWCHLQTRPAVQRVFLP